MIAATMKIGGKMRRIEERGDGLWYLTNPEDQAEFGSQGKLYMAWYRESDQEKNPRPKSTMVYS